MSRRSFLTGLGAFFILPSAGRIWKATIDTRKLSSSMWSDAQLDLYNKLPYYLVNQEIKMYNEYMTAGWKSFAQNLGTYPSNLGETKRALV